VIYITHFAIYRLLLVTLQASDFRKECLLDMAILTGYSLGLYVLVGRFYTIKMNKNNISTSTQTIENSAYREIIQKKNSDKPRMKSDVEILSI